MSGTTWDREPLWQAVRMILKRNGPLTAGDITAALEADGLAPEEYSLSRIYQLLREKQTTGELVTALLPETRARTYSIAADMPAVTLHLTGEEYAALFRIGRKIHCTPEDTARRLMQAGIAYMRGVLQ